MAKFAESWQSATRRVPDLTTVVPDGNESESFAKVVHGPEAFTPDGEFLLGETAVTGLWVAAGFCVHGLAAAGGVGKVIAEWIVDGTPEYDTFGMDIRRFPTHASSPRWSRAKAIDSYSKYYDIIYPGEERTAARPLRRSPAWPRHQELGAAFGEKAGWERVNWFDLPTPGNTTAATSANGALANVTFANGSPHPRAPRDGERFRPAGWAGKHWSPAIRAECLATRDAAALFDQTSFAKLEVTDLATLQHLCAADLDRPVGTIVYTQMLNDRGGIEADVTVTRLTPDRFRIITGTAFGVHDATWLRTHGLDVQDVTSAYACYCLWGPNSLSILSDLTEDDLTFPYMQAREITVGNVPVLAQRVTFTGEFGWELYCPTEYALTLWDTLMEAGAPHGMRPAGYRALDSLRLEKGYRVWGLDISPETTPHEAGLSFAVSKNKNFLGRPALTSPDRSLHCLVLADPTQICLGGEPVRVNGRPASRVTSGGYGHRVDQSIAYAYLPLTGNDHVEIGVNGTWTLAAVADTPLYDPSHTRVRGLPGT